MPALPVREKVFRNADERGNEIYLHRLQDCVRDDLMIPRRRPGLSEFTVLGTGAQVDGVFEWLSAGKVVAVSDGRIFRIEKTGVVTEVTGATLESGTPVSFAEYSQNLLLMANGGKIVKWDGGSTCSYISDADAPTKVSSLAVFDTYVIALEKSTSDVWFSEVSDPDTWNGEFFSATKKPDNLEAIVNGWSELALIGKESTEYWADTGDAAGPFEIIPGAYTERGTLSPHTVRIVDNTIFYLDNERKVVRMDGRSPVIVSNPIDPDLQALETVTDAVGMLVQPEGLALYVLAFPTEDRTFVYDFKLNDWYDWGKYDTTTGTYSRWDGNCSVYVKGWNMHLVGGKGAGKIYEISSNYSDDDGVTIRNYVETGWVNFGTNQYKRMTELWLTLRRGSGLSSGDTPYMMFSYQNERSPGWSQDRHVDLGKIGETESVVKLRQLGRFRRRKFRFVQTDAVNFSLISAEAFI